MAKSLRYWLKIAGIGVGLGVYLGLAILAIFSMFMAAMLMLISIWLG